MLFEPDLSAARMYLTQLRNIKGGAFLGVNVND